MEPGHNRLHEMDGSAEASLPQAQRPLKARIALSLQWHKPNSLDSIYRPAAAREKRLSGKIESSPELIASYQQARPG